MMRTHSKVLLLCLGSAATTSLASGQLGLVAAPADSGRVVDERLVEARAGLDAGRMRRTEINVELGRIGPTRRSLKEKVALHGRALYRLSRNGMIPVAGGFDALLTHASRVARLERLVASELRQLTDLDRRGISLQREAAELDAKNVDSDRTVRALEKARVDLATDMSSERLFESAFSGVSTRAASDPSMQYGLTVVGGMPAEHFTTQRGSLALPVSGPSSIREARRAESDGPGLELLATPSSAVRAAASGRVAFADRYGSYGQIVILDHGERYYTVYGGLGSVEVQVGDDLSKSARLGSASADPVYFEVRRGTKADNARAWLGL